MAEVIENENVETNSVDNNNMYIDTINELKQSTVSKAQYEQLQAENKKLLDSLANGDYHHVEPEKPTYDLDALKKKWTDTFGINSNLIPAKAALEYRDAYLETTGIDLFAPNANNPKYEQKQEDLESAQNAAEVLRSCIEDCHGSDATFYSLLCDRTTDDPTLLRTIASRNKTKK